MPYHGITTETVKRFFVDAGAVYVNYGLGNERLLGATRDGNEFVVEQEVREIPVDGAKGPLKGARRIVNVYARITANLIEMTAENFLLALPGADATAYPDDVSKTHDSIRRIRNIQLTDYVDNIALVGTISGSDQPIICIVENALADGNLQLSTADNDEAALTIQFTAHFDPADLDTEPWEVRYPTIPA